MTRTMPFPFAREHGADELARLSLNVDLKHPVCVRWKAINAVADRYPAQPFELAIKPSADKGNFRCSWVEFKDTFCVARDTVHASVVALM